jgi:hypothetical protein
MIADFIKVFEYKISYPGMKLPDPGCNFLPRSIIEKLTWVSCVSRQLCKKKEKQVERASLIKKETPALITFVTFLMNRAEAIFFIMSSPWGDLCNLENEFCPGCEPCPLEENIHVFVHP